MSDRHVLTVEMLQNFLENAIENEVLEKASPIIIIENDAGNARDVIGNCHDQFEGLRLCNVGGIVYNEYEHEKGLVLGFSYETRFKDIIKNGPTKGCFLGNHLIDIKSATPMAYEDYTSILDTSEKAIKEIENSCKFEG